MHEKPIESNPETTEDVHTEVAENLSDDQLQDAAGGGNGVCGFGCAAD